MHGPRSLHESEIMDNAMSLLTPKYLDRYRGRYKRIAFVTAAVLQYAGPSDTWSIEQPPQARRQANRRMNHKHAVYYSYCPWLSFMQLAVMPDAVVCISQASKQPQRQLVKQEPLLSIFFQNCPS